MRYHLGYHALPLGRLAVALTPGWSVLIVCCHSRSCCSRTGERLGTLALGSSCVPRDRRDLPRERRLAGRPRIPGSAYPDRLDRRARRVRQQHRSGGGPSGRIALSVPRLLRPERGPTGARLPPLGWYRTPAVEVAAQRRRCWNRRPGRRARAGLVVGEWWESVASVGFLVVVALPVSMGVAILRYRLYEIDRLVSRTLSYAILTGLLIAVYFSVVTLATLLSRSRHLSPWLRRPWRRPRCSARSGTASSTWSIGVLTGRLRRRGGRRRVHEDAARCDRARYRQRAVRRRRRTHRASGPSRCESGGRCRP